MSHPAIFVVGPEGSGTTLLSTCVRSHPHLAARAFHDAPPRARPLPTSDAIVHVSLPALRPMVWVEATALPLDARVVLVRRSPLHTVYSAYRRFYRRPQPAWRAYLRAVAIETGYVARHDPLCVFYEDLVHHPGKVLRALYAYLGVDAGFVPSIRFTDRNDERWRGDATFTAFARQTFGLPAAAAAVPTADPSIRLSFRCYGAGIVIDDASGAGIGEALRGWLPPNVNPIGRDSVDAAYRVEQVPGGPGASGPRYRVLSDGQVRFRAPTSEQVLQWLRGEVERLLSETSRGGLFVHAGVVGWRGRAILIPGRTMTGKSTLVAELVRLGATYYSDEFAVLDDAGRVHPYARPPTLRDSGIVPSGLARRDAAEPLPVGLVVSTTFRADVGWRPEELRGIRAAASIIDNAIAARQQPRRLVRLAAKVATHAAGLRGPRPDAAEVAPRLLAYLDAMTAGTRGRAPGQDRAGSVVARARAVLGRAAPEAGEIRPPRFVQIEGLLDRREHRRLLAYALAHARDFTASAVIGPGGESRVDERIRRSGTLQGLGRLRNPLVGRLTRLLPHVRRELGFPWFPLGKAECQVAVHREGGFFGRHVDNGSESVAGRRLTCVYYFHGRPKSFSGGALRLYESVMGGGHLTPASGYVTIEPVDNSAVFFPSDTFHEVCPVTQRSQAFADSRFSVTVWFWVGAPPGCLRRVQSRC